MAKSQGYNYAKRIVKLDFSFPEDKKILENKKDFCDLLAEALRDLMFELDYIPKVGIPDIVAKKTQKP